MVNNQEYKFEVYDFTDFSELKDVKQVYAILFSKDRREVAIVKNRSGHWFLPGGGVENNESLTDTLIREVKEETNWDVVESSIKPLYYQVSYKKNGFGVWERKGSEVRYTVYLKKVNRFKFDPDNGDVVEVKWVSLSDIDEYLKWGQTSTFIIEKLLV